MSFIGLVEYLQPENLYLLTHKHTKQRAGANPLRSGHFRLLVVESSDRPPRHKSPVLSWLPSPQLTRVQPPHGWLSKLWSLFSGTLNTRCRILIGTQKETIILTTTHMYFPFLIRKALPWQSPVREGWLAQYFCDSHVAV